MQCDHSLESHGTVLSFSAVFFVLQCGFHFLVCGSSVILHLENRPLKKRDSTPPFGGGVRTCSPTYH